MSTTLNQTQKHYHCISKIQKISTKRLYRTENITAETFLVTLDYKSLYTTIPNHEGMEVAKETLNSFPKKLFTTKVVIRILFEILTLNNFIFNGIHYVQKLGCVMGTICIPNYSNIFRGNFERNFMHPHFKHS